MRWASDSCGLLGYVGMTGPSAVAVSARLQMAAPNAPGPAASTREPSGENVAL